MGFVKPMAIWLVTSALVFFGAWLGYRFLPPAQAVREQGFLVLSDGLHYRRIVCEGYRYDPGRIAHCHCPLWLTPLRACCLPRQGQDTRRAPGPLTSFNCGTTQ